MSTTIRRSSYYSRLPVPSDLHAILRRYDILKSLRTRSYRLALARCRLWEAQLTRAFVKLRRGVMTPVDIEALITRHIVDSLEADEQERAERPTAVPGYGDDPDDPDGVNDPVMVSYEVWEDAVIESLNCNSYKLIDDVAERLWMSLKGQNATIDKTSPAYLRLCRELLKAELKITRIRTQREYGRYPDIDRPVAPAALTAASIPAMTGLMFSEALKKYFEHYAGRANRTQQGKAMVLGRFIDILGGDRPINRIEKKDLICFRDTLSRFPQRVPIALRGKPISSLLDYPKAHPGKHKVLGRGTVNGDLTDLHHFFAWAIKHDLYCNKNPVDGISFENVKQTSFEPFTDDDLQAIFASPNFLNERHGNRPERYWLLLILLYTGARREEIAQLLVSDIKVDGDVLYFDLTPDESRGTRLKNDSSKRQVPVHSRLVAVGLLDYVKHVRKTHGPRSLLFPLKPVGRPTVGDACSKWFNRHLQRCGVKGKKALHSFRPTVISRLHAAGMKGETVRALVGHAGVDVHETVYLHVSLATRKEAIEELSYHFPGIG